ncbi:MAG: serine/threonine-protein kinase [Candidatus Thermoplasmatota archaeon]
MSADDARTARKCTPLALAALLILTVLLGALQFGSQPAKGASIIWSIETVDSAGDVGECTSLALDSTRNAHISYYDGGNDDLKYARWTGNAWAIETVDSAGDVGLCTSIALDSSGIAHISYHGNGDLKYARWTGSAWAIETVDSAGDVGYDTSLALDSSGNAHISYFDWSNEDLKYARWTGSAWAIETVDSAGGSWTSLALDSSEKAHISYCRYYPPEPNSTPESELKYARWTGSAWAIETVDSAGHAGEFTSLALDSSGNAHISYYDSSNGDLKYARWTGNEWAIETVDSIGHAGEFTSLALDSSGNAHISYCGNGDLKYARWTGSGWAIETVDIAGDVGLCTSIALDSSWNAHISYYDDSNGDLKYARFIDWDSDSDGVGDNSDAFPNDPNRWKEEGGGGIGELFYGLVGAAVIAIVLVSILIALGVTKSRREERRVPELFKYSIIEEVTTTYFSRIYKVKRDGKIYALKVPPTVDLERLQSSGSAPTVRLTREDIENFKNETEIWRQFSGSQNVVQLIDAGTAPVPWIVMEYMPGGSLDDKIERGVRDVGEAVRIAIRLLDILAEVHTKALHKDLKPANFLYGQDGTLKISDFGLARLLTGEQRQSTEFRGTMEYASPEHFDLTLGKDRRTDIWAVGVILYQMLTGSLPFSGDREDIVKRILREEPRPPSELNPNVPKTLDAIILRALAKRKEDRWQSAAEFRKALENVR